MNRNDFDYTINFLDMVEEWVDAEIMFIKEDISNEPNNKEHLQRDLYKLNNLTDEDKMLIAKKVMDDITLENDNINDEINDNIHYYIYHNTQQDEMLNTFVGLLKESK